MKIAFECYRELIPVFSHFQEALHRPLPTHLRVNSLKCRSEQVVSALEERGMPLERCLEGNETLYFVPGLDSPGTLLEYYLGHIHPQALTSCLASLALVPARDAWVLDLCAAPGGKTSHLAQIMDNHGLVVANEPYPRRQISMGHTLSRLGVLNAIVTAYQAQEFPMKTRFDHILADVPCSGEGTFRFTRSKRAHHLDEGPALGKLVRTQQRILLRGFDLLREGGTLLYSTCTYNPRENESVVNYLLQNRDATVLDIDVGIGYEPGITEWQGEIYDKRVEKAARFYPHRVDSVGFFMARIGK